MNLVCLFCFECAKVQQFSDMCKYAMCSMLFLGDSVNVEIKAGKMFFVSWWDFW